MSVHSNGQTGCGTAAGIHEGDLGWVFQGTRLAAIVTLTASPASMLEMTFKVSLQCTELQVHEKRDACPPSKFSTPLSPSSRSCKIKGSRLDAKFEVGEL